MSTLATIFVTLVHLTNGHTVFSGIDAKSPELCLTSASNANSEIQLLGWQNNPKAQRMILIIKQQWKTDIEGIEFTCMSSKNYNESKETEDSQYWTPIQN